MPSPWVDPKGMYVTIDVSFHHVHGPNSRGRAVIVLVISSFIASIDFPAHLFVYVLLPSKDILTQ